MTSEAQTVRQDRRDKSTGRYRTYPACEACGKSTGLDYWSMLTCDRGPGLTMCNRKFCPGADIDRQVHQLYQFENARNGHEIAMRVCLILARRLLKEAREDERGPYR